MRRLWDSLGLGSCIDELITQDEANWIEALMLLDPSISTHITWKQALLFYLWNIWLVRNNNHHHKVKNKINQKDSIIRAIEYMSLTNQRKTTSKSSITYIKWHPPKASFKLSTGGSTKNHKNKGGIGGLIRDKHGN